MRPLVSVSPFVGVPISCSDFQGSRRLTSPFLTAYLPRVGLIQLFARSNKRVTLPADRVGGGWRPLPHQRGGSTGAVRNGSFRLGLKSQPEESAPGRPRRFVDVRSPPSLLVAARRIVDCGNAADRNSSQSGLPYVLPLPDPFRRTRSKAAAMASGLPTREREEADICVFAHAERLVAGPAVSS
jgi:hypothetical protein